ncbi:hypothetical protein RSO01_59220 [Reyranella soli]|jgi:hypothetical protein|uniref:Uncharacterized protein n=1 Tax=Reyranella soli TaxID=1230389 RepID=A0A512NII7_9HYPH|nr:hypothetical protein RSO01_59220 [Reyranella soli]
MIPGLRKAAELKEVPVHWVDICRVMQIMGLMEDFSEGECLRISSLLKESLEAGTAKKLSRGVYTAVHPDHVAPDHAP